MLCEHSWRGGEGRQATATIRPCAAPQHPVEQHWVGVGRRPTHCNNSAWTAICFLLPASWRWRSYRTERLFDLLSTQLRPVNPSKTMRNRKMQKWTYRQSPSLTGLATVGWCHQRTAHQTPLDSKCVYFYHNYTLLVSENAQQYWMGEVERSEQYCRALWPPHFWGGQWFSTRCQPLGWRKWGGAAPPPHFWARICKWGGQKRRFCSTWDKISYFFTARTDGKSKISARAFCARRSIELYQEQLRSKIDACVRIRGV